MGALVRSPQQTKTPAVAGPGLSGKTRIVGEFILAKSRLPVNTHGLFFRLLPVAGLGLAGGWAARLVLWLPMADMAARLLRALMEARV